MAHNHAYSWMYGNVGLGESYAWNVASRDPWRWSAKLERAALLENISAEFAKACQDPFSRPIFLRYYEDGKVLTTTLNWIRSGVELEERLAMLCLCNGHAGLVIDNAEWRFEHEAHKFAADRSLHVYDKDGFAEEVLKTGVVMGIDHKVLGDAEDQEDLICVAFRGSATFMDFVQDVGCQLDEDDELWRRHGVKVHSSFWSSLSKCMTTIMDKIEEALSKCERAKTRLMITGHSLGGAMAMLFHARLWCLLRTGQMRSSMVALLGNSLCVALAGPMVFAPISPCPAEDMQSFEGLKTFLAGTVTNYMFQNDPVPRAYAEVDIEKAIAVLGLWVEGSIRKAKRFTLGAAGIFALAAGAAVAGPGMLVAAALAAGASGGAHWLEGEKGWIANKLDDKDFFKDFQEHAVQYRHCCQVRVFRELLDKRPWQQIDYGLAGLGHHSSEGYVNAIQTRGALKHYEKEDVLFISRAVAPLAPPAPFAPPGAELLALYKEATMGQFDPVVSALGNLPPEVVFDDLVIPSEPGSGFETKPWHFIHQAAFCGRKDVVVQIMALGASPLKLTLDGGKTIVDVAEVPGAFPEMGEEEKPHMHNWLKAIFARAACYQEIYQDTGMIHQQITRRVLADLEEADVFSLAVLLPLDLTQRAKLIKTYLIDSGYSEVHLKAVDPELEFEDENLTIQRAEQIIKEAGYNTEEVKLDELAHEFLDCAKFRHFDQALAMLQKNPALAAMRPLERWSAAMQLAYTGGPRDVAQEVLACYSSARAVLMVETDLVCVRAVLIVETVLVRVRERQEKEEEAKKKAEANEGKAEGAQDSKDGVMDHSGSDPPAGGAPAGGAPTRGRRGAGASARGAVAAQASGEQVSGVPAVPLRSSPVRGSPARVSRGRGPAPAPTFDAVSVESLTAVVKKCQELAVAEDKFESEDPAYMRSLIDRAMASCIQRAI